MRGDAGVDDQLAGLSTEGTGGCLGNFHLHGTMNGNVTRANRIFAGAAFAVSDAPDEPTRGDARPTEI